MVQSTAGAGFYAGVLVLALVTVAQAIPMNCSAQFQAALHQVVELRKTCGEAVYRDCCDVSIHVS